MDKDKRLRELRKALADLYRRPGLFDHLKEEEIVAKIRDLVCKRDPETGEFID